MDEKDKKDYELAVLVKTEDDLAPVVALVRQHNGEIIAEPRAKKLALAYEIKKNKEAIFAYSTFKATGEDVKNLERDLNTKAEVIRFLLVIPTPPNEIHERPTGMPAADPTKRRTRMARPAEGGPTSDAKPSAPKPLSNEALEKKIEEILK